MKTVKVAAAVIRSRGAEVFATARGYGDYKGFWEFPGGKAEPGETTAQALRREIQEELATEIRVGELIDTQEHDYPTFHLSMGSIGRSWFSALRCCWRRKVPPS